jgi:hypothetical protein
MMAQQSKIAGQLFSVSTETTGILKPLMACDYGGPV